MKVAYQGAPGAFGEQAVQDLGGEPVGFREFVDVLTAITVGTVPRGVLPVENALIGPIGGAWQALEPLVSSGQPLRVVGEVVVPVRYCLIRPAGAPESPITRVISHPAALAQCRSFFAARPELEEVSDFDTAGALDEAAGQPGVAVIAAERAAELRGAAVLARHIEDDSRNATRFLVFALLPEAASSDFDRALIALEDGFAPEEAPPRSEGVQWLVTHRCQSGGRLIELAGSASELRAYLTATSNRHAVVELGCYPASSFPFRRLPEGAR